MAKIGKKTNNSIQTQHRTLKTGQQNSTKNYGWSQVFLFMKINIHHYMIKKKIHIFNFPKTNNIHQLQSLMWFLKSNITLYSNRSNGHIDL